MARAPSPLLAIVSAVCTFFTGFQAIAISAWFQPFVLLHFFHESKISHSSCSWSYAALTILFALVLQTFAASLAFFSFYPGQVHKDLSTAACAPSMAVIWSLGLWILLILPFLASIGYRRRFDRARTSQPLVFASIWTTVWFAWNRFGGVGALLNPAMTQASILPLVMSAGVWGIDGITFLMAWFSALLHDRAVLDRDLAKMEKSEQKRAMQLHLRHAKAFGAIFLLAFFYGSARTSLLSGNFFQKDLALTIKKTVPVSCIVGKFLVFEDADVMLNRTRQRLEEGDRLVLWAESAVQAVTRESRDSLRSKAGEIASQYRAYVGITYEYRGTRETTNRLDLFLPNGSMGFSYSKAHPVPFVESYFSPGVPDLPAIDTEFGRIGGAICFDFEFPQLMRQAGQKRIDIMLQPAETWGATGPRVYEGDSFRAAENGFSWFRCSSGGISSTSDPYLQTIDYREAMSDTVLVMNLPVSRRAWTFYPDYGFVIAWLLVAMAFVHLAMLCLPFRAVKAILERSPNAFVLYVTGETSFSDFENSELNCALLGK